MRDSVKGGALTEVSFYVLLSVYTPRHGYGIMQFVEEKTSGRLTLGAGTLYGAINILCEKGLIAPFGEGGGRKKEYVITDEGKAAVEGEIRRLRELLHNAESIAKGE